MKHIRKFKPGTSPDYVDFNKYYEELSKDWEDKNCEILDNVDFQVWSLEQPYNLGSKKLEK